MSTPSKKRSLVPNNIVQRLVDATPEEGSQPLANARLLDMKLIDNDPNQPRKVFEVEPFRELVNSLALRGLLQPITVQRQKSGRYRVITGERRWRAAVELGWMQIPALVVDTNKDEMDIKLDRIEENRQRTGLKDYEMALALQEIKRDLREVNPDVNSNELDDMVGEKLTISGRTVRNYLAMLKLPDAVRAELGQDFSELRARGLSLLKNQPDLMFDLVQAVNRHNLSGNQTVQAARLLDRDATLTVTEAVARVRKGESVENSVTPKVKSARRASTRFRQFATDLNNIGRALEGGQVIPTSAEERDDLRRLLIPIVEFYQRLEKEGK